MKPSKRSPGREGHDPGILSPTLSSIAAFYDECKVGYQGCEGYRKSTDLYKMVRCIQDLDSRALVDPRRTIFLDLGCADGRVNVLMSYFVKKSIGIEIDPEILAEYQPRSKDLRSRLREKGQIPWPNNVILFQGSSLDDAVHERVYSKTGVHVDEVDLFYTYITLHDLFAERIAQDAKPGALYLVYGFNRVLPRYAGLNVLIRDVGSQGIAALYGKGLTESDLNAPSRPSKVRER